MSMWLAIGRTALEYWYLVASGIVVVAWWSQRDTRRFEDHVDLGMSCLQAELEKFPPALYANMHPNWSVYRKKFQQALGVACPGLSIDATAYVLEQFDGCYEFDDGVYSRFDSRSGGNGDTAGSYVPLVAPFEKRPFVRVETRRRRRRIVRFLIGAVAYSVLVVFVIGFLVFARQQGW